MIEAKNAGYAIDGKSLLRGVSFRASPGEITMIVGPNGAGKSTLIKLMSQQWTCSSGAIQYYGRDLNQISKKKLAKTRAVLSQKVHMAFPLTVQEVVMMGRYPHFGNHPTTRDEEICQETMDIFDVSGMRKRNYLTLSGGERQRVHFARVMSQIWPEENHQTKTLLLDEPLSHLDIYYQYEMLNRLKKLMERQQMTIIGVVHDLNLAYKFADKALMLYDGEMISFGEVEEVFTGKNIKKAFGMEASFLEDGQGERHLCF